MTKLDCLLARSREALEHAEVGLWHWRRARGEPLCAACLDPWAFRDKAGNGLSAEGAGFGQLEVTQVDVVDGRAVLLFSCLDSELSAERRAAGERGGIWAVNAAGLTGPYDIRGAYRIADQKLYSGRIVRDRSGSWVMLAFRHTLDSGAFVGEIIDPLPIGWKGNTLSFTGPSAELSARVSARALGGPRS